MGLFGVSAERNQVRSRPTAMMTAMSTETDHVCDLGRCEACVIRHKGICNALNADELQVFRQIACRRVYAPGDVIVSGDSSEVFFAAVVTGVVKLTKLLSDGRQQIVGLLFPPDCVGRPFGKAGPHIVEAATDVELCCFPYGGFQRMLTDCSGLSQRLLGLTLDQLEEARDWMVLLGRKTALERVASLLLMLATRSAVPGGSPDAGPQPVSFELHLRRAEIADFLGLTYETVCRQISALGKDGVIRLDGKRHFQVLDRRALAEIADVCP